MYFDGAHRGWVMVPTSSNWSRWCLFTKELVSFLSISNTVSVEGKTSDEDVGGGLLDGGGQNGKKSVKIGNQRKFRKFEISRANSGHNVLKGNTVAAVSSKNGRPTRDFKFELTFAKLALRVSKLVGGKRMATWVNPNIPHKSNFSGPSILKLIFGHDKAHGANSRGNAQGEFSYPRVLGVSGLCNLSESVVGEGSKAPMESTVLPEDSLAGLSPIPSSDQASELLIPNPTSVFGVPETGNASVSRRSSAAVVPDSDKTVSSMDSISVAEVPIGLGIRDPRFTGGMVVSLATAKIEALIQEVVSQILGRNPWVVQNRFSPLSDLGNGVDDEFVEGEDHEVDQRSNHLQRSVDFVGEFQTVSGLHLPPWETSEVFGQSCGSGEKDIGMLECDPLSRWEPNELRELVLVQDSTEGTQVTESGPPSNCVFQLMKNFCNMVGCPIMKHEAQCLALFRLLE